MAQSTEKTRSAVVDLVPALEDDIFEGVLKPGSRLGEQALANRFNVSRTLVRESLRELASSGLVVIRKNHGATVKILTITELVEMFQVMAELEGLCARLCARRMKDSELSEMRRHNELCEQRCAAGDHDAFFTANNVFHETIYTGSHNTFLQKEALKLRNRINVYRRRITFQPRRMTRSIPEHWKIVESIEAGDEDGAHRFMREHVDLLTGSVADVLLTLEDDRTSSSQ